MAGGSDGCRVALVMRHLTPGLISSSRGTAGLTPFIAFSTSYPKLDSVAAAGIETWSRRNQFESRFHLSIVVAKIMQIPAHYALRNFDALGAPCSHKSVRTAFLIWIKQKLRNVLVSMHLMSTLAYERAV
jgi:hypothetical protein